MPHFPGTYLVERNGSGHLALFKTDHTPITDPTFESVGVASFVFEIDASAAPTVYDDEEGRALTWVESVPTGTSFYTNSELTSLTLEVTTPPSSPESYQFHLHFTNGQIQETLVIASPDGTQTMDPTIIEKPPGG